MKGKNYRKDGQTDRQTDRQPFDLYVNEKEKKKKGRENTYQIKNL